MPDTEVCDWCGSTIVVGESFMRYAAYYWHDGCADRLGEMLADAEYGTVKASESVAADGTANPSASDDNRTPAEPVDNPQ
jgi:hypothetical protein